MAEKPTTVFLCECATHISGHLDLEEISEWLGEREEVACVGGHNLLCSPAGKEYFKETLREKGAENIVIAACSPKEHERTFQDLAEEAGVNMGHLQMANIREHCAWVTPDREEATEKAKWLIRAAIQRSRHAEALEKRSMEVSSDVLVIGGGVAGIEAALTAAAADRKVTIVEKGIALGGTIAKVEDVAPNMECSSCVLAPRLAALKENPNIEILSNAEVTEVLGFYGKFTARVRKKARFVEDNCIGCEMCFEVCPVDVSSEFNLGLSTRKAIYTFYPGSVPAAAVIDREACKHFEDGSCDACVSACPLESINFNQQDEELEINVGAVILATGAANGRPSGTPGLGYDDVEDVYTLPEFERIVSASGPYAGEFKTKGGKEPGAVAVIHCAGSLRDDGIPYCSRICCMSAAKVGQVVREHLPDAKVYNIHNDLVFAGPREREFYRDQVQAGTAFVKCPDLTSVQVTRANGTIKVAGEGFDALSVDLVVLATGLQPTEGTAAMAEMLHIDVERGGFFKPDHDLLHSTGASLDGIYIAGCAAGPCDVPNAVTQAQAAAGDAVSKLVPGREIDLEVVTSFIDEEVCAGCKLCISVCPYKAVSYDPEKKVCRINEVLCRGCGTCTANCSSGASQARSFTDDQIFAEIGGVLNG